MKTLNFCIILLLAFQVQSWRVTDQIIDDNHKKLQKLLSTNHIAQKRGILTAWIQLMDTRKHMIKYFKDKNQCKKLLKDSIRSNKRIENESIELEKRRKYLEELMEFSEESIDFQVAPENFWGYLHPGYWIE